MSINRNTHDKVPTRRTRSSASGYTTDLARGGPLRSESIANPSNTSRLDSIAESKTPLSFRIRGVCSHSYKEEDIRKCLNIVLKGDKKQLEHIYIEITCASDATKKSQLVCVVTFHDRDPEFLGQRRLVHPSLFSPLKDSGTLTLNIRTGGLWEPGPGIMDSEAITIDAQFRGLTTLYEPSNPEAVEANVIAIMGLTPYPYAVWMGETTDRMWLRHFFTSDPAKRNELENCRTIIFGYHGNIFEEVMALMSDYIDQLVGAISLFIETHPPKPIILVGHSYGGILAVNMIRQMYLDRHDKPIKKLIFELTRAMLLYGTPHRGMFTADLEPLIKPTHKNRKKLIQDLRKVDSDLLGLFTEDQQRFARALREGNIKVYSFVETEMTRQLQYREGSNKPQLSGEKKYQVTKESGSLWLQDEIRYPADGKNHRNLVKFDNKNDYTFQETHRFLQQCLTNIREDSMMQLNIASIPASGRTGNFVQHGGTLNAGPRSLTSRGYQNDYTHHDSPGVPRLGGPAQWGSLEVNRMNEPSYANARGTVFDKPVVAPHIRTTGRITYPLPSAYIERKALIRLLKTRFGRNYSIEELPNSYIISAERKLYESQLLPRAKINNWPGNLEQTLNMNHAYTAPHNFVNYHDSSVALHQLLVTEFSISITLPPILVDLVARLAYTAYFLSNVSMAMATNNPSKLNPLRDAILSVRVRTVTRHHFVTFPNLQRKLTESLVADAIIECYPYDHRQKIIIQKIIGHGLRVFAALAILHQEHLVLSLIEGNLLDSSLPIDSDNPLIPKDLSSRFCSEVQWEFLPHKFIQGDFHKSLRAEIMMPYTHEEKIDEGSGGDIFKCVVHPHQYEVVFTTAKGSRLDLQEKPSVLIRKRIKMVRQSPTSHQRAFRRELELQTERALVSRIGYHHDIRPKNVLVTQTTFVLTDFGVARLKFPGQGSQTLWPSTIGDYIAPECMDEDYEEQVVGRSIDIWSLGCLLAEVVTYMKFGSSGVTRFRAARRVTEHRYPIPNGYFFEGDNLRASVEHWLTEINSPATDPGVSSLIAVIRQLLHVDYKDRPVASLCSRKLTYIQSKIIFCDIEVQITNISGGIDSLSTLDETASISPYESLGLWFESKKLSAWGTVLQMHEQYTEHRLFNDGKFQVSHVLETLRSLHSNLKQQTALSARTGETLRIAVAELWGLVPQSYQRRMEQEWRTSALNTSPEFEDVSKLSRIEESGRLLRAPFSNISTYAALKRLQLQLWRRGTSQQKQLLLKGSQIDLCQDSRKYFQQDYHQLAWLTPWKGTNLEYNRKRRVIIEWLVYTPAWEGQTKEEKATKLLALAELLHCPKPEGFHVLDCVGIIEPNAVLEFSNFGFAYDYPEAIRGELSEPPTTLASLLGDRNLVVPLEYKFLIAKSLCESIWQLHSSNWLHKAIQPSNVLFFRKKALTQSKPAEIFSGLSPQPYLIGFQHSRPNGDTWYSDTDDYHGGSPDYRHPNYIPGTTRFQKAYDYYGIGIMLLEIGFWEPLASFRRRHKDTTSDQFRESLLRVYAPKLGPKMGSLYKNIVIKCLSNLYYSENSLLEGRDVTSEFYWEAVAPLCDLNIA
ncbi:hypothetical protein TWF703_009095 [Orbilia oligospora]|uniref:Protein kinase domain-containing protein n=1 Tax=Orbilia oligospora TaxID=2813651 RepID=A0A7C8JSN4_ORBOL|nr:hypothetical protein TWF703_009095 [Orbilia oligospora]